MKSYMANDVMDKSDILELFNERAAIREFDGKMKRDRAEYLALRDVRAKIGILPEWLVIMVRDENHGSN